MGIAKLPKDCYVFIPMLHATGPAQAVARDSSAVFAAGAPLSRVRSAREDVRPQCAACCAETPEDPARVQVMPFKTSFVSTSCPTSDAPPPSLTNKLAACRQRLDGCTHITTRMP